MKVIVTYGLPASGKSTFAKELLKQGNWVRVNKDDLRLLLHGGKWSRENEKVVEASRDMLIATALAAGKNVVVDDTNLHPKHIARIKELVKGQATVEVKDFTDVSVEECIRRDSKRSNYVGEKVIRNMYNQFLRRIETPEYINGGEYVVICDLDGTLCLFGDSNPYERNFLEDKLNRPIASILKQRNVIITSGRNNKFRTQTEEWLRKNDIRYLEMFMRADGDVRKDSIVKREMYDNHIRGKYNVTFVLDDRPQVCRVWHELGLPLLKFGDPDADF
jgi:predicted kinase